MAVPSRDTELAGKLLAKYEKDAAGWNRNRWILLVWCVLTVGACLAVMMKEKRIVEESKEKGIERYLLRDDRPPDVPPEVWYAGSVRKAAHILELRYQVVTFALFQSVIALLISLVFSGTAAYVLVNWNRGGTRGAALRIIRAELERRSQDLTRQEELPTSRP